MNAHITNILDKARRAPSVLNSQPWRFRVCGNTIEVYLEKQLELEPVDPSGRLQMASCGTLVAHLENSIQEKGWNAKVAYFPRFEEENLVAFVEISGFPKTGIGNDTKKKSEFRNLDKPDSIKRIKKELADIASGKDIGLIIHTDSADRKIHTNLKNRCGEKLESECFRKSLNLFLRSELSDTAVSFEDEVLLSDRFFEVAIKTETKDGNNDRDCADYRSCDEDNTCDKDRICDEDKVFDEDGSVRGAKAGQKVSISREISCDVPHLFDNQLLILTTDTDNRYEWIRTGEVLGNIVMQLRNWDNWGLMALPIISNDNCRDWLKNELKISGYPQFVLKMQPDKPREHIRKRPLKELLKYGF